MTIATTADTTEIVIIAHCGNSSVGFVVSVVVVVVVILGSGVMEAPAAAGSLIRASFVESY
jgi:chemotaxis signal transduction protein